MLTKPSSCDGCILQHSGTGFMNVSGTGRNGVMLVGEALGADEAAVGLPFVGKAGFTLDKLIKRGGMERDDFWVGNVLYCQPPGNKLSGMPYADDAIAHCAPNLDNTIQRNSPKCIVTLGVTAFRRVLPEIASLHGVGLLDSKKSKGAINYVFWSEKYQTWVIPTVHPSFIMRGQTAWAQVLIFCLQKACEIAQDGYSYEEGDYTLDCTPQEAHTWVDHFERYYVENKDLFLSCDIETPEKDSDESELDLESNSDYIILRCGYSYRDSHALSIPWDGPFRTVHERLLTGPWNKCWWNGSYDQPRIISQNILIAGTSHDGMDAWHILNSDLKKSLNFVTPWFRKNLKMWKHLSGAQPAFYNAVDADAAGSNLRGTIALLKRLNMYKIYEEFVLELDPVFSAMTRAGMPIDMQKRVESAKLLTEKRKEVLERLDSIVPTSIKPISPKDGYKKTPKDTSQLTEVVFGGVVNSYCSACGIQLAGKSKPHFKSRIAKSCGVCGKKWTAKHGNKCTEARLQEVECNPCVGGSVEERLEGEKRWARIGRFVPSTKGVLNYQKAKKHPIIFVGKGAERKATTDEKALRKLQGKYPDDPVYLKVIEYRELTKVLGTYIGYGEEG